MNFPRSLAFAFAFLLVVAPTLFAQDAAAPIRRTTPLPAEPAPTPMGMEEEATPTPTPRLTPTPRPADIPRSSDGMPLPTPVNSKPTATAPRATPTATATPAARQTPEPTVVRATPPPVPRETPEPVRQTPPPTPASTPVPTPAEIPTPGREETPLPTATPAPTAAPQPTRKVKPIAAATPTPSAPAPVLQEQRDASPTPKAKSSRVFQEKPVRAAERRPADFERPKIDDQSNNVGASRPTFDLSNRPDRDVATTVKRLENRWQAAILDHDVQALNELLASDFVGTSSTGKVGSKYTLMSALKRDKNTYTKVEARGMSVRTPSEDIAIVTGITREAGTTPEGKSFKSSRRFTDTWVKRSGEWRCVASQTTEL